MIFINIGSANAAFYVNVAEIKWVRKHSATKGEFRSQVCIESGSAYNTEYTPDEVLALISQALDGDRIKYDYQPAVDH